VQLGVRQQQALDVRKQQALDVRQSQALALQAVPPPALECSGGAGDTAEQLARWGEIGGWLAKLLGCQA